MRSICGEKILEVRLDEQETDAAAISLLPDSRCVLDGMHGIPCYRVRRAAGGATLYPRCVCRSLPLGFQGAHFVLVSDDACPALRVLKYARLSTRERCKVHSLATLIADLGLTTTTTTSSTR